MAWAIEVGKFKNVLKVLSDEGCTDIVLKFDPEKGLNIRQTDPSKIALIDISLPKEKLVSYDDIEMHVAINIDDLLTALKKAKQDEEAWFSVRDTRAIIELRGKGTKLFKLPLLDIAALEIPEPKLDFTAKVVMDAKEFKTALEDAQNYSTNITIEVDGQKEELRMMARGARGNYEYIADRNSPDTPITGIEITDNAKSTFKIEDLRNLTKPAEKQIVLWFGKDMPMKAEYQAGDYRVMVLLAPIIETQI